MEFLRTPDEQFENLPDFDFEPHYLEINGARMHYVDTENGSETLLMATWRTLLEFPLSPHDKRSQR